MGKDVEAVVGDVESKKWIKAAEAVKTTVQGFETALKDCEGMDDDVQAIKQWSSVFHSKAGLIEQVSKHMLFHASEIKQDVSDVKTEWNGEQYFQSGKSAADLLTVAIGPIKTTETEDLGLDLMMLPDLAAGFVYGMVGDNKLTEFEACYSGVPLSSNTSWLLLRMLRASTSSRPSSSSSCSSTTSKPTLLPAKTWATTSRKSSSGLRSSRPPRTSSRPPLSTTSSTRLTSPPISPPSRATSAPSLTSRLERTPLTCSPSSSAPFSE